VPERRFSTRRNSRLEGRLGYPEELVSLEVLCSCARRTGRLLVENPLTIGQVRTRIRKATQRGRLPFSQVNSCFREKWHVVAKCLSNDKGSQVQILSARPL